MMWGYDSYRVLKSIKESSSVVSLYLERGISDFYDRELLHLDLLLCHVCIVRYDEQVHASGVFFLLA